MIKTISLDPKILILKADYEDELNDFIELAEKKERNKKEIDERHEILKSLAGVFEKCGDVDLDEMREERLKKYE